MLPSILISLIKYAVWLTIRLASIVNLDTKVFWPEILFWSLDNVTEFVLSVVLTILLTVLYILVDSFAPIAVPK